MMNYEHKINMVYLTTNINKTAQHVIVQKFHKKSEINVETCLQKCK